MRWTLRRAGWWIADYAWAGLDWVSTLAAPATPDWFAVGTADPVVLIPGYLETWRFLRPLATVIRRAGHPVHLIPALDGNRRSVTAAVVIVEDYLAARDLHRVRLVGHSKGGLIGKLVLARNLGGRVDRLVALNTPFHGSSMAKLLLAPDAWGLRPDAPLLAALEVEQASNAHITSIFSRWDEHVPEGSHLGGAVNVELMVAGHHRPLGDRYAHQAVLDALA